MTSKPTFRSWILLAFLPPAVFVAVMWVPTLTLGPVAANQHVLLPGKILPFRATNATAELSGRIDYVLVSRGTQVKEGQLLAVVEGEDTSMRLEGVGKINNGKMTPPAGVRSIATQQVRAPQSGTILSVGGRGGDSVWPGLPIFKIADLTYLRVDVPLSAAMAKQISTGMLAIVRLPIDSPEQIAAKVTSIALVPDLNYQSHVAQIAIPNPKPGTILVGRKCMVEFAADER